MIRRESGRRRWLMAVVAIVTVASACSGGDQQESNSTPDPAASEEATTPAVAEPPPPSSGEGEAAPPETTGPGQASTRESACPGVPAGVSRFELEVEGNVYSIRVLIPTDRDGVDVPLPVVLNWHGLGSNGFQQAQLTGYDLLAEQDGFLAVHPTGLPATELAGAGVELPADQRGRRSWELAQLDVPGRDDVAMASELIDRLVADYCGDETRIYSTGMSNGGFFTSLLVCELSDRLAAAVSVAGLSHPDDCAPQQPVPFMAFHGTADQVVPYSGGDSSLLDAAGAVGAGADIPPEIEQFFEQAMPEEFEQFAASFGCDAEPAAEAISEEVTALRYTGCDGGVPLVFHRIEKGGHTWPGSPLGLLFTRQLGETTFDVSATIDGWRFMRQFSLNQ
jgi:polyhydroxybutyrate depolymerase